KNVFDTLVGTILDIEGKTKDTIKARLDLERMGIRRGLWMNRDSDKARRDLAFFSMKPNDKKEFLKFVSSVKFPDGYASNIARCLRHDIVQVLCKFEMIFPPAFFTSMMHVMVHLPEEALLAGPVNYRWMYPIERLLGELKKSVRNRAKPEGSIIEAWVQYESLTFCGMYLKDVETAFNRPQRNNDGGMRKEKLSVFAQSARPFGDPGRGESFSRNDMEVAHWFVLNNCDEIMAYLDEHEEMMKREHPSHLIAQKQRELFPQWFLESVQSELEEDNNGVSENLRWLAAGPNMAVPLYRNYLIKGIKFNIKAQDDVRTTQNSGVYLLAQTMQVASAKDKNPILSNMGFYGVIQEIWDLDYQKFTIQVFRCDWIDSSGLVVDELGFTLVDLSKIGHRNDQFVLASQVKQIFFVDDPMHRGWSVVLSMPNREYNDVIGDEVLGDVIIECEPFTRGMPNVDTFDELV
ncbi:PREDICTED: transposase, partial [Prunus dulcis]